VSIVDKQIASVLRQIHQETLGVSDASCRWYYSHSTDIYHCSHTAIFGKDVIPRVHPAYARTSPAIAEWEYKGEVEHRL